VDTPLDPELEAIAFAIAGKRMDLSAFAQLILDLGNAEEAALVWLRAGRLWADGTAP